jgi:hypothetical protein
VRSAERGGPRPLQILRPRSSLKEELARTKVISEDVTIADRLNQVIDDYKKYLR